MRNYSEQREKATIRKDRRNQDYKARTLTQGPDIMGNSHHTVETWHLWSWQTKNIELTEYTVDHGKSPWFSEFPKYPELCKMLAERVGTSQFIWCYTEDGKPLADREEWELRVPEGRVRLICSITWNWILSRSREETCRCEIPIGLFYRVRKLFREFGKQVGVRLDLSRTDFQNMFHDAWKSTTTEELWDMLFVDETKGACTHALVLCPIEEDWIKRRPS
jgi:hypothetical protein